MVSKEFNSSFLLKTKKQSPNNCRDTDFNIVFVRELMLLTQESFYCLEPPPRVGWRYCGVVHIGSASATGDMPHGSMRHLAQFTQHVFH